MYVHSYICLCARVCKVFINLTETSFCPSFPRDSLFYLKIFLLFFIFAYFNMLQHNNLPTARGIRLGADHLIL